MIAAIIGSTIFLTPAAAQVAVSAAGAVDTLTLDRAVQTALQRNRDVRAARLALDQAGGQASEAWAGVLPSIDLNASYTRNISPPVSFLPARLIDPEAGPDDLIPVRFGADNLWNSTIRLEQPLFQAQAFLGVGASRRYLSLQEEVLRGAVQSVVTRVRVAYYDVLLGTEQARLLETSVDRVRAALQETRAMYEAGVASEYDVLRLEVELANLEPNLRRARNAVVQSRRNLAVELGISEVDEVAVAGSLAELNIESPEANTAANRTVLQVSGLPLGTPLPPTETLVSIAEESRSDIRQLELTRSLRRTELRAEQLEYAPKITLFGDYVITAQESGAPGFFGSGRERAYGRSAGISLSMPIFSGFRENARIRQRRAVVRTVETQTELARDRAEAEVRSLVDRVAEARDRTEGQRLAVQQARRGFEIAAVQYREGISSQLERTDAEVALRESEFNYAQAVYDYLVARAQLDEAVGRTPGMNGSANLAQRGDR
ncbi:MAG TPA: TolC family protein [Gemmatimonadaceae bacterium]|nr:TolC family protein [Gemmatimonadaceae bacterium]